MQHAAVDEDPVFHQMNADLPAPTHKRHHEEDHDQAQQGIAPSRQHGEPRRKLEIAEERSQSAGIHHPVQNRLTVSQLVLHRLIPFVLLQLSGRKEFNAEPLCNESAHPRGLRNGVFLILLNPAHQIGILLSQYLLRRRAVQVFVHQVFGTGNAGFLGNLPDFCVILSVECRFIRVGEEDSGQADSENVQSIPSQEAHVRLEQFPLVTLHHFPREGDDLIGFHGGIFRQNIRHQCIGIPLNHSAHDGQCPQETVQ